MHGDGSIQGGESARVRGERAGGGKDLGVLTRPRDGGLGLIPTAAWVGSGGPRPTGTGKGMGSFFCFLFCSFLFI